MPPPPKVKRQRALEPRRMPVVFDHGQLRHRPRFEWAIGKRIEHMERATRAGRILSALESSHRFELRAPPGPLRPLELERTHSPALVRYLRAACRQVKDGTFYPNVFPKRFSVTAPEQGLVRAGFYCFDAGTPITRWAYDSARLSAACAAEAARMLLDGETTEAYALCRPPGHHAEHDLFGGYCYFNNAALATNRLRDAGRVAIVDIDFHHGNGTQQIFYRDAQVLFVSIHGDPHQFYPYFSGYADETGEGPGAGTNLNFPLRAGVDDAGYRELVERRVFPAVRAFKPASLVVSAGFDTYAGDPIGEFNLSTAFFSELGERFAGLGLPTVIVQEGGYQIAQLGTNVRAFLEGFLEGRTSVARLRRHR
jgi:acetoin utilization deacetylase AcuC-like enzyme